MKAALRDRERIPYSLRICLLIQKPLFPGLPGPSTDALAESKFLSAGLKHSFSTHTGHPDSPPKWQAPQKRLRRGR